jgi:hypothetical protein
MHETYLALLVTSLVVLLQKVLTKIACEVAPDGVDVVGFVLGIV